ncbi:hypothetical protein O7598_23180 [Micromonospora sp. WMMC241]|uniref:hypothetical protein n=1 Tax=Micromonospora sp. WMMC241 TaxID=3015159 RepID=UPI0022B6991E|nr:hypothetical protein [Micromonospora sp. WMMC241]MCZ7439328.1 hypothetical protein [Micromonospora sp. WMMC241]
MNVRQVVVGVAAVFVVAVTISAIRWFLSDDRSPESLGVLLLVSVLPGVVGALIGLLAARWVTGSRRRGRANR